MKWRLGAGTGWSGQQRTAMRDRQTLTEANNQHPVWQESFAGERPHPKSAAIWRNGQANQQRKT